MMFTPDEIDALRPYGIAVHRDKLILDARPPAEADQVRAVEARLAQPLPSPLRALWRASFGGTLDYDVDTVFATASGPYHHQVSLRELYTAGGNEGPKDLFGWLEYDRAFLGRSASAGGRAGPERLDFVPIGGFEELERVYVSVREEDRGRVFVWAAGLGPQWKMYLSEDAIGFVATDVDDLFDQLRLDSDPFVATDPATTGTELVGAIGRVRTDHPHLADGLVRLVKDAIFHWRVVLARGPYRETPEHDAALRVALDRVSGDDDTDLLGTLLANDYPLDRAVSGVWPVISWAAARGANRVVRALLSSDRPLGQGPIVFASALEPDAVEQLLHRKVAFDAEACLSLAGAGKVDVALRVAAAAERSGDWSQLRTEARQRADVATRRAKRMEEEGSAELTGPIVPQRKGAPKDRPRTPSALRAQAQLLRDFSKRV